MSLVLFFISLLCTQNLWAFKLNLAESTINLEDGVFSTTATIINDGDGMIAIEASPRIRKYTKDGVENFDTEAEDLIIVPSQMIIPAKGEQVLNIRWIGPRDIAVEKAYRLLIEYVSVSDDKLNGIVPKKQQAGININYRIAKSFYVSPRNAKAEILLQKAQRTVVKGKEMLQLSCTNLGSKHYIAHALDIEITTASSKTLPFSFQKDEIGGSINFLPQEERIIYVPWPKSLNSSNITEAKIIGFGQ